MKLPRIALSIRAQLLLVLTVFLALPWLGVEYVRELERVLARCAGANARGHGAGGGDRAARPAAAFRGPARSDRAVCARARRRFAAKGAERVPPSASPEIAQIIDGLSRTTARIWVIDRDGTVLARAGTLKTPPEDKPDESLWAKISRATIGRLYALVLEQPQRGLCRRCRHGQGTGRPRCRGRARRHPYNRPPADVRCEGGHRQRCASHLGRRLR